MEKLVVENLHVNIGKEEILKGISITVKRGEIHALMGPNGAGKSCLANALMGHPKYTITKGKIFLDGKEITESAPDERARLGLFLSFQYPSEITGVTLTNFLRTAHNAVKEKKLDVMQFHTLLKEKMALLGMDSSFSKRYVNEGFSGGEKKRAEILQMSILSPKYAILDETDSGLDIDSIRIVGNVVNKIRDKHMGILIITHYHRILSFIKPDTVSILVKGKIVKTGNSELAQEIEKKGFDTYDTR